MPSFIKLKLLELDERDVQLTKRELVNTTASSSNILLLVISILLL